MKFKRKRDLAAEKQSLMETGGGPFKKPKIDNQEDGQVDLIVNVTDTEIEDPLDSDSNFMDRRAAKVHANTSSGKSGWN